MTELKISGTELSKLFGTNRNKEEDGTWVPLSDTISLKIRRWKSRPVQEAGEDYRKPYTALLRAGNLPEKTAQDILEKTMAKAVIVDWKGVTDGDQQALDCTFENKLAILKLLPDLRDEVLLISQSRDTFKEEGDKEALGN
jgi:hypothetical protein